MTFPQFLVVGHDHRPVLAEDFEARPIGDAALEPFSVQGLELAQGNGQQLRMMGRDQGSDKVKCGAFYRVHRFGGIVAFVENQGDMLALLGQLTVTLSQFLGDRLEDGAVIDIARIDLVEQRDMKIGAHQQAEVHLA